LSNNDDVIMHSWCVNWCMWYCHNVCEVMYALSVCLLIAKH